MRPITTFWLSKLILMERNMLIHYGAADADVLRRADGSFMIKAFLAGWYSALRRSK
jgi:hypothetical protein